MSISELVVLVELVELVKLVVTDIYFEFVVPLLISSGTVALQSQN